ncbi:hypothetical protein TWF103_005103 [Orbilia oligospora]|uniref:Clr5 domain-containing protein n=1 Tax=Orbilia oligospora TaxID=2813651 RepID=A0A7C8JVV2_ORBOL|nr:hypothetical protein TWF103_005103 [Orbilia oligospora]KAF3128958.1 hypothetical protein TWF703_009153 [Orbilia oligospora]
MGKPWETYKQEIYRYYIEEGKPLAEVREILKAKYNFEACKRSYQNQIEVWGFKKNVRSADMRAYLEQKQQNIPDSEMGLSQDIIDKITPRKVRRYEKRYAGKSSPSREATSPRESRRPEEYENWESYDVDQHSLFDYPDSYPVTPSHGSEDHFYTGDMISKLSYSAATLGEPIYASTAEYSTMGSLTATDYGYRSSHDAHARYRSESQWHIDGSSPTDDLMKAALAGRYDGLRRLLMGGETPNVVDRDGNTSLHYLVRGFHKLLDRAAHSPGLLSGDRTVGSSEEFEERIAGFNACLNLLLSYGAMATPNERGDTAAQMASARLAEYTKDPYNAAAGTHKQWTQFVNSMSAATSEYTR